MNNKISAKETLQLFCHKWFEQRDAKGAARYIADDVDFVGTGANEAAQGRKEMEAYLCQDIEEMTEPFACDWSVIHEQPLTEDFHNLSMNMTLKNTKYTWYLRGFFTLVRQEGRGWLIKSFHFAEPANSQRGSEHYPHTLVVEDIAMQRQEMLNDSVSGGMMGGYMEEGYPFYFVNWQMLKYLGYESEEDFVTDIEGLITNCMHLDDREMVDREVIGQLEEKGEYVVEYRMKKKDGSYIWVRDLGRKMTAEDGRPAITSVCIDITHLKEAQDEILYLYNSIPGAVFRCCYDEKFTVIDANEGLYEFLEYTREEFAEIGSSMARVTYPEDMQFIRDRIFSQLQMGNTFHFERRLICKSGTVKWISLKGQLLTEKGNEPFLYCVFVDITEEKQLRERVKELYDKELSYFAELSATEGYLQGRLNVTRNQVESFISSTEVEIADSGDSYDEIVESLAASAVDAAYGESIRLTLSRKKVLADYAAGRTDYHFEFLRRNKNGGAFWGSTGFRSCLQPETRDIIVFFYTKNVTESKIQEQLLNKITALDYDSIIEVDMLHGSYRTINFEAGDDHRTRGQGMFPALMRETADYCADEAARMEYLEKLDIGYMREHLVRQESYSFMVEMCEKLEVVRVKKYQVFYISKDLGRVCVVCTDVTDVVHQEQRQKEELASALVAAEQANVAKTDFLSRMSHEIRTPMNAIIGMSAIAAQAIGDDERVAECISKIGISSRFLLSLINDILDMSRIESGKMLLKNEKIPLEEFINGLNSICYTQASAKGVEYECIVDPVLDDCYMGDAMKLQQVLINILSNAIKFTSESGKVTFSTHLHRKTKNGAILRFIINDTGIGMDEEYLPHIFEPFSQESTGTTALFGGTGLGLSISKSIVDMMDGKITVRSIKGIGTEFTVDVKLGISEEEKLRHHQRKHEYHFSYLKTLVVDDDVAVCESAVVTLKEMGVTAEWVDSGRKAVNRVKELWGNGRHYDMILIDWKMPDMDGIETARCIRAIVGPEVTIIIVTAYEWSGIEHEAKLAGVNLLMSKPMFKSSLISAFTRALGEKEEKEQTEEEKADYDFTGKRVLLAEDNALNTEVAVMILENKGFQVDKAENGLRAMELFSKSSPGYYDAILMDIRMPLMDGLAASVNIRHLSNEDASDIPIIAMTANAFDDDMEKSKAAGMNAHLAKPIDPDRLYQVLYHFIFEKDE